MRPHETARRSKANPIELETAKENYCVDLPRPSIRYGSRNLEMSRRVMLVLNALHTLPQSERNRATRFFRVLQQSIYAMNSMRASQGMPG